MNETVIIVNETLIIINETFIIINETFILMNETIIEMNVKFSIQISRVSLQPRTFSKSEFGISPKV